MKGNVQYLPIFRYFVLFVSYHDFFFSSFRTCRRNNRDGQVPVGLWHSKMAEPQYLPNTLFLSQYQRSTLDDRTDSIPLNHRESSENSCNTNLHALVVLVGRVVGIGYL